MPRQVFDAGDVLSATDVNTYLMDQMVQTFAGTAARGSAIGTAVEGMVTYLNDSNSLSVYNGTAFTEDRTIQVFAGTAARGSAIPTPVEGMYAHLNDTDTLTYHNGSAWVARVPSTIPFAEAAGVANVASASPTTVTFPTGRFSVAPLITMGQEWVTSNGAFPAAWPTIAYDANGGLTSTYMLLQLVASSGTTRVFWRATQMTSGTASG